MGPNAPQIIPFSHQEGVRLQAPGRAGPLSGFTEMSLLAAEGMLHDIGI